MGKPSLAQVGQGDPAVFAHPGYRAFPECSFPLRTDAARAEYESTGRLIWNAGRLSKDMHIALSAYASCFDQIQRISTEGLTPRASWFTNLQKAQATVCGGGTEAMAVNLIPDTRSSEPMPMMPDETSEAPLLSGQGDLKSDVRLLAYQVALLDKKLDRFFDEVKNNYATKSEVKDLKEDVDKLNANIGWLVKIIIGAVVVALLGLVIVKGGVAPR